MRHSFRSLAVFGFAFSVVMTASAIGIRDRISKYIPQSKYRTVLVLAFESHEANPLIGQAAADSMAASLGKMGFIVVDRSFARKLAEERGIGTNPTIDQIRELAKELNVAGIVKGIVSETGERQEKVAGYIQATNDHNSYNSNYNAWGQPAQGRDVYAKGSETQTIANFSASASLTDLSNGSQVWSYSLADHFTNSSVQSVANSVMDRMAVDMGKQLMSKKY